jgi:hypothetical protein
MADEREPPNKRRRPPTTIDLKATELASESASPAAAPADPAREAPAETAQPATPPEPEPVSSASLGGRERTGPSGWNARVAAARGRIAERINWRLIAAGAAGAALLAVLLALWGAAVARRDDQTAARLSRLEQQARDLANRPQPAGVDPGALAGLAGRLAAAEQAMGRLSEVDARVAKAEAAAAAPRGAQPDAALTARVTALEAAQKAPPAPTVSPAEVQALAARVAALEQMAKAADEKIARAAVSGGADRVGRLAFVAAALRGAVERGEPFGQELAATKPLLPDAAVLAPLEPFAASGVPRTAALARELSQLTAPMLRAAGAAPREGGILDRIQQNAEGLVRIRPISETPGDDAATILARAEAKASRGDLAAAVSELGALPPAVRAPGEPWIKQAQAQAAALAAARKLADDAVGALSKAAP